MDALPQLDRTYLGILEYFQPIATTIHPELSKEEILAISTELAHRWLEIEKEKAINTFYERNGISLSF